MRAFDCSVSPLRMTSTKPFKFSNSKTVSCIIKLSMAIDFHIIGPGWYYRSIISSWNLQQIDANRRIGDTFEPAEPYNNHEQTVVRMLFFSLFFNLCLLFIAHQFKCSSNILAGGSRSSSHRIRWNKISLNEKSLETFPQFHLRAIYNCAKCTTKRNKSLSIVPHSNAELDSAYLICSPSCRVESHSNFFLLLFHLTAMHRNMFHCVGAFARTPAALTFAAPQFVKQKKNKK